jgi:hypothetical protein
MTRRPGFALIYALLTTMALSLVALGIMARGTAEAEIASAIAVQARARAAAEATALDLAEAWSTGAYLALPAGATVPAATAPLEGAATATVTRLDSALFLLRVESIVERGRLAPTIAVAGLLVRILYPPALLAPFSAALTAIDRADVYGGEVNGEDPCGDTVPGIGAPIASVGPAAHVTGDPPVLLEPAAAPHAPDPLASPAAAALATLALGAGTHIPRPLAGPDGCIEDDRNWGALAPDHPCHGLLPLIHADGPVTIAGGEGRGVLVVNGNARFQDASRFSGVVVVHGTLFVQDGSRLRGAVRAEKVVLLDGSIRRDHCEISPALAAPALDRAFRPPGRWWVPVF